MTTVELPLDDAAAHEEQGATDALPHRGETTRPSSRGSALGDPERTTGTHPHRRRRAALEGREQPTPRRRRCRPTKAVCLDALVLEGVLTDDSWRYVAHSGVTRHAPVPGMPGALWLAVTDPTRKSHEDTVPQLLTNDGYPRETTEPRAACDATPVESLRTQRPRASRRDL